MGNLLLPILAGTLPPGDCPSTLQEMLVLFSNNQQAVLPNGRSFYSYGDTKPAPEFQAYPWLYSVDMQWYKFDGNWIRPNPSLTGWHKWEEFAQESDIWSYDGGDGTDPSTNPPGNRTGAMWQRDPNYDGRSPMSPGPIPGLTVPHTVLPASNDGAGEHALTDAEGATGIHTHAMGLTNQSGGGNADDAFFSQVPKQNVVGYNGFYITGGGTKVVAPETQADLFTLPAGAGGAGVTPTPFSLVHPVRGMFCIVRTARVNFVIP